jgi:RNA polymerase sigma-70 factor (ECF subfamily)
MGAHAGREDGTRTIVYCVVPFALSWKLHEPLREHFAGDPSVEVVVERRGADRRRTTDERRRADAAAPTDERRRIHNAGGRRIGPRRAATMALDAPELPRRLRRYAADLTFVERVEPAEEHVADLDSARLVTRFQGGDPDAFGSLYLRYFDRVYAYLLVVFRNDPHEAEDVTQQVFVAALTALPRYQRRKQPFRAWLFTIARNQAISRLRQRDRMEPVAPAELAEHREAEPAEATVSALSWLSDRELVMFVERLPIAQRQVLVLRYMLDLPTKEIGAMLGRNLDDIRTLEHRALRFLEARLSAVGHGHEETRRRRSQQRINYLPVGRRRRWALLRNPGRVGVR